MQEQIVTGNALTLLSPVSALPICYHFFFTFHLFLTFLYLLNLLPFLLLRKYSDTYDSAGYDS